MQPNNPEIFLGDKLIGRANSVTVHKSSAVGKSEHVLAAFARRQQASPHEMFMSPSPGASRPARTRCSCRRWPWP